MPNQCAIDETRNEEVSGVGGGGGEVGGEEGAGDGDVDGGGGGIVAVGGDDQVDLGLGASDAADEALTEVCGGTEVSFGGGGDEAGEGVVAVVAAGGGAASDLVVGVGKVGEWAMVKPPLCGG